MHSWDFAVAAAGALCAALVLSSGIASPVVPEDARRAAIDLLIALGVGSAIIAALMWGRELLEHRREARRKRELISFPEGWVAYYTAETGELLAGVSVVTAFPDVAPFQTDFRLAIGSTPVAATERSRLPLGETTHLVFGADGVDLDARASLTVWLRVTNPLDADMANEVRREVPIIFRYSNRPLPSSPAGERGPRGAHGSQHLAGGRYAR